jgi:cysteinyl-tRNA synthetase
MSGSLGNVVSAKELAEKYGADLVRYFLLSTHYRRPIEFTEEVLENNRKGMAVFSRLFERVQMITGAPASDEGGDTNAIHANTAEESAFLKTITGQRSRWIEMMDDDFNTAGAIGVMHDLAGDINAFIERNKLEQQKTGDAIKSLSAAATTLKRLCSLLGLFRQGLPVTNSAGLDQLTEQLMQMLIQMRADARQSKNFALADDIRKRLTDLGINLEDRAGGTIWRKG